MSYYRFHFLCLSIYFRELHFSMQFSRYTLVGPSGLEPPTSRLSGARSNQLSYEPIRFWLRGFLLHLVPLVEMMGIEPMTPCLQGRCSPS